MEENIRLTETNKYLSFCWTRQACILFASIGLQVFSGIIHAAMHASLNHLICSFCNEDVSLLVSEWEQRKMMSTYVFRFMSVFDLKGVWFWVYLDPGLLLKTIYRRKLLSQSCSDIFEVPVESALNHLLSLRCDKSLFIILFINSIEILIIIIYYKWFKWWVS